jgi:serine phosphatase RsbU (regulator of sigma subunit)
VDSGGGQPRPKPRPKDADAARIAELEHELEGCRRALAARDRQYEALSSFCFALAGDYEQLVSSLQDDLDALERTEAQHEVLENFCFGLEQEYERAQTELRLAQEQLAQAHARLANSFDDLKRDQALREIDLKRMGIELETARLVQRMLIPKGPPPGLDGIDIALSYVSAEETSGDWIGFDHDEQNKQLAILIGDVTGHGMAPALVTAGVFAFFSTMRQLSGQGAFAQAPPLTTKLTWLDHVIYAMGQGTTGMSFFATVLDYEKRTAEYCSWGHPAPYLIRPADLTSNLTSDVRHKIRSLRGRGPLLGLGATRGPRLRSVQLERDDLIVFFTDGVVENCNSKGEAVGEGRLQKWLAAMGESEAHEARDYVSQKLRGFVGSAGFRDDMALVFAKVR